MKSIKLISLVLFLSIQTFAQGTSFTYQGNLKTGGIDANGSHDFEFALFAAPTGFLQLGPTLTQNGVTVTNGIFSVTLDFGNQFPGASRFLEIRVRQTGGGAFTPLNPRQPVASTPYAIKSTNSDAATTATNATQLGGVVASQFVQTGDPRLTDARDPLPGSNNYIRNSGASQPGANLNIGGAANIDGGLTVAFGGGSLAVGGNTTMVGNLTVNGTLTANLPAGNVNYIQNRITAQPGTTNFNINGSGTIGGTLNATTVNGNIFSAVSTNSSIYQIGGERILSNFGTRNIFVGVNAGATGTDNSFFGFNAGNANLSGGIDNSFFGSDAGGANTSGSANSFFGSDTGDLNTTGFNNSFFGRNAGGANTTGSSNSFFGYNAGIVNVASNNSFFGALAGSGTTSGTFNAFFGFRAGGSNTTGDGNAFFGSSAGFRATTANNNSFFGNTAGFENTLGSGNSFFGRDAGYSNTTGSANSYFGENAGQASIVATGNSFFGSASGIDTRGSGNSFFGASTGPATTTGENNSFFGRFAGLSNISGDNNTLIGSGTDLSFGSLSFATAIGADAIVASSNTVVLGRGVDSVWVPGMLKVFGLGPAGSLSICRNSNETLATCSSSLRYKTNIGHFGLGLHLINQLRPITFDWKQDGMHDLGLGAEDVAAIEPLLVTYNSKGEVEGVKYDRIGVVLVNAVKEQQKQIDDLKAIVCELKPAAAVCKK